MDNTQISSSDTSSITSFIIGENLTEFQKELNKKVREDKVQISIASSELLKIQEKKEDIIDNWIRRMLSILFIFLGIYLCLIDNKLGFTLIMIGITLVIRNRKLIIIIVKLIKQLLIKN